MFKTQCCTQCFELNYKKNKTKDTQAIQVLKGGLGRCMR